MLVLSRRIDESIIVDGRITVTVVDIRSGEVRLGIDAPRSISIHRKEVFEAIEAENIAAATGGVPDLEKLGRELGLRKASDNTPPADGGAPPPPEKPED